MKLTVNSSLAKCFDRLERSKHIPQHARSWVEKSATDFESELHENLIAQRANLSGATLRIYAVRGKPNGSGIRNHISHVKDQTDDRLRVTVGIASGKPTMVAKVQEYGTTIAVTDKMRAWFRRSGINLRSSTVFIRIPGRRFWSKSWHSVRDDSRKVLNKLH
jgi:hypothetical protein